MKKANHRFLFLLASLFTISSFAQSLSFPGTRMGNYTGVQSVFFNPAQVADSRYSFDLNLFGINAGFGNNKASYSLSNVFSSFNSDDALNSLFSGDGRISGQLNVDVLGPSLQISLPKKSGIAFTSRLRAQFSITDLDGKLAKTILNDLNNQINFPYTISSGNNMRINTNGWAEYGLTYGRVFMDEKNHLIKGGVTFKYLAGAGNSYIQVDQLSGTLTNNPSLPNSSIYLAPGSRGTIGLGISGNVGSFTPASLIKSTSTGFGADIGVSYEYRTKNSTKPYKFKLSLALLDLGSINYDRDLTSSGTYNMLVTGSPGFNLQSLQGVSFDNYKQVLSSSPYFTPSPNNNNTTLSVSLPTSLQVFGDLHLLSNLYLSAGTQIALSTSNKAENPFVYSTLMLIPRYEGKAIGLYLPVTYNTLTQLTMGATLRLGPLFVGSGSILSALLSNSKQADFNLGLHIGVLKKRKNKEQTEDAPKMQLNR